ALSGRGLEMHAIAPAPQLTELATRFRNAVRDSAANRDDLGARLYSELFGKLSKAALDSPAWLISSADSLFDVPFSSLLVDKISGHPVYVLERHQTGRIPSAFTYLVSSAGQQPPAHHGFLGIGDGVYNTADPRYTQAREASTLLGFLDV